MVLKISLQLEFAEKLTFFSQTQRNGFESIPMLSRIGIDSHTPKSDAGKSQNSVKFWIFPRPH